MDRVSKLQAALSLLQREETLSAITHAQILASLKEVAAVSTPSSDDDDDIILAEALRTIPRLLVKRSKKQQIPNETFISTLLIWGSAVAHFLLSSRQSSSSKNNNNNSSEGVECGLLVDGTKTVSCLLQLAVTLSRQELAHSALGAAASAGRGLGGALGGSPQKFILKMNTLVKLWSPLQVGPSASPAQSALLPREVVWECLFVEIADSVCRTVVETLLNNMSTGISGPNDDDKTKTEGAAASSLTPLDSTSRMGAETIASVVTEQATRFCEKKEQQQKQDDVTKKRSSVLDVGELRNLASLKRLLQTM